MQSLQHIINSHFEDTEPFSLIISCFATFVALLFVTNFLVHVQEYKQAVVRFLFRAVKALPAAQKLIDEKRAKAVKELESKLFGHLDLPRFTALPADGLGSEQTVKLLLVMRDRELDKWNSGKISGAIYVPDQPHVDLISRACTMFTVSNPLHPDLFPSIRKMEAEIVRMTATMMSGGEETCGSMTSGGTESLIMALKVYRDQARQLQPHITHPEVVAPRTVHPAVDKGCSYLGLRLVSVPVNPKTLEADVDAMRRAITSNTVLLIGSATNYPHGILDPIPALAALAREHQLSLHVDCCLGGFVLPFMKLAGMSVADFDFRVPGVTSISADTHKYGLAPKGSSVLLFRTHQLRRYMYFATTEWPGGLYASPGLGGSRPGALVAGTWAALVSVGQHGFVRNATRIADVVRRLCDVIASIDGIEVLGKPVGPVVAWAFKDRSDAIFRVNDLMSKRGWSLSAMHKPNALHLCVTAQHADHVDEFGRDLRQCVEAAQKGESVAGGFAPVYGMASSLPDRQIVSDMMGDVLDVILTAPR